MKKVIWFWIMLLSSLAVHSAEISYREISLRDKTCGQIYEELVKKTDWYGKQGEGLSINYANLPAIIKPITGRELVGIGINWNSLPVLGIQLEFKVPAGKRNWRGVLEYYNHLRHALIGKYGRLNLNNEVIMSPYSRFDSDDELENAYILGYISYTSGFFDYDTRTSVMVEIQDDWRVTVTFRDVNQEDVIYRWKSALGVVYDDM